MNVFASAEFSLEILMTNDDVCGDVHVSEEIPEVILDEHMDLLRALEMSRLQYLRDSGLLHEPEGQKSVHSLSLYMFLSQDGSMLRNCLNSLHCMLQTFLVL